MVRHAELAVGLGTALCLGWLAATLPGAAGAGWSWRPASGGTAGGAAALPPLPSWLVPTSMLLVTAAVAVALSLPEGRLEAWRTTTARATGALVLLLALAAARLAGPPQDAAAVPGARAALPPTGTAWSEATRAEPPQAAAPARPPWTAIAAAAGAAALLAWGGARRAARVRAPGGAVPAPASPGPRPAAPVSAPHQSTVVRCWARMVELLGPRAGRAADPPFTPRELARALAERGCDHPAVARLTELFEEVRYGGKPDAPRRDEALAALAALEETYGRP